MKDRPAKFGPIEVEVCFRPPVTSYGCFPRRSFCRRDAMNLGGIKVSSAEIERELNLVEGVAETAAIAVAPPEGGPNQLAVFVVREGGAGHDPSYWMPRLQEAVSQRLNPLFRSQHLSLVAALPRTASNKVMRRTLRESLSHEEKQSGVDSYRVAANAPI